MTQRRLLIGALGTTQILAWGSSYYLPAVLAVPTSVDTGWPLSWVVGGLSAGLLVAGLVSVLSGRFIQRYGGRPVLVASSMLLASALTLMATAATYPVYLSAWLLMGLGMATGLYDAGFATLGRLYGASARSAITTLTLFGGFASTVCWPLSAYLVEAYGWRGACLWYAAIHLFICLPLHLFAVPSVARPVTDRPADRPEGARVTTDTERRAFMLLAVILTCAALIASMVSVHLLVVLQARGLDLATAVTLGALIGPAQVGARVAELAIGRNRHHPVWTMLASVVLLASGLGLLLFSLPLTALALILYGAGNGIHTIARGALPLVLFDPHRYAALMGQLAMPSLVAQAAAPSIGAVLIGYGEGAMLGVLFAVAMVNVGLVVVLSRFAREARQGR